MKFCLTHFLQLGSNCDLLLQINSENNVMGSMEGFLETLVNLRQAFIQPWGELNCTSSCDAMFYVRGNRSKLKTSLPVIVVVLFIC